MYRGLKSAIRHCQSQPPYSNPSAKGGILADAWQQKELADHDAPTTRSYYFNYLYLGTIVLCCCCWCYRYIFVVVAVVRGEERRGEEDEEVFSNNNIILSLLLLLLLATTRLSFLEEQEQQSNIHDVHLIHCQSFYKWGNTATRFICKLVVCKRRIQSNHKTVDNNRNDIIIILLL